MTTWFIVGLILHFVAMGGFVCITAGYILVSKKLVMTGWIMLGVGVIPLASAYIYNTIVFIITA